MKTIQTATNTIILGMQKRSRHHKGCQKGKRTRHEKRGGDFGQHGVERMVRDICRMQKSAGELCDMSWFD